MSLLTIVQNAMLRQGQVAPTSVVGNSDTGVTQRLALLQAIGNEVAERDTWEALDIGATIPAGVVLLLAVLNATATVSGIASTANLTVGMPVSGSGILSGTTVAAIVNSSTITLNNAAALSGSFTLTFGVTASGTQTKFPLPSDWNGLSEGEQLQSTLYPTLPVIGPVTNEQMNAFKALPIQPLQPVWRVIQGSFEFYPAPALGECYTYNYYSKLWVQPVSGPLQASFQADTDVALLDEETLTVGLEWRWLKSKGLDYAEEFRRFELRIGRAAGRDDNSREVAMSQRPLAGRSTWPGQFPIYDGNGEDGADLGYT